MTPNVTPITQSITAALPVYNEQATLSDIVSRCLAALETATTGGREVLIVNDGSTDGSARIARELADQHPEVRVHEHGRNLGFAAVQKSCYRQARMDWIFLLPADGQIDPATVTDFLSLCASHDLLLGLAREDPERGLRRLWSQSYHAVVNAVFGLNFGAFGPCLMVRRELAQSVTLKSRTPVAMTELVVRATAAGAGIGTVSVHMTPRVQGAARGGRMLGRTPAIVAELAALYFDVHGKSRARGEAS